VDPSASPLSPLQREEPLFSESGFQAGAIKAARATNISLTSIGDFQERIVERLAQRRLEDLDERAADLIHRMETAWHGRADTQYEVRLRYIGPSGLIDRPDVAVVGTTSVLSMLRQSLEAARYDKWPVPFAPLDHGDHAGVITVNHWDALFFIAEETIRTCELIYTNMIGLGDRVESWKELQSEEMTELLEHVRAGSTVGQETPAVLERAEDCP
jgi:hypothetical protein